MTVLKGTGILLIEIHKGKERQHFRYPFIVETRCEKSANLIFTKSGKFTCFGDFYNTIITYFAVWRNTEMRRLDSISMANLNCGRNLFWLHYRNHAPRLTPRESYF